MSYKKALESLEALPPEQRKLGAEFYENANGDRCVIGTLLPEFAIEALKCDRVDAAGFAANSRRIGALLYPAYSSSELLRRLLVDGLSKLGLTAGEAGTLQALNDRNSHSESQEERYLRVVEWLRQQVPNENANGTPPQA
jgi:hypothetical protein